MKAIETLYKGFRFRSRTEARWAVFFDTLSIPWSYELEGFDMDGTRYLPDFWLPQQSCWVEIKGPIPTEEENRKASLLAQGTKKTVFILWGNNLEPFRQEVVESKIEENDEYRSPITLQYHGVLGHRFQYREDSVYLCDTFYRFAECLACGRLEIVFFGIESDISCYCGLKRNQPSDKTPRLLHAYKVARQERFGR